MQKFKVTYQLDEMDCGPSCLVMIAKYYGKNFSLSYIRENSFITKNGVSLLGISQSAQNIGFETVSAKLTLEKLKELDTPLPCIIHWNKGHFAVLYKISQNFITKKYTFHIADPAYGLVKQSETNFIKGWISTKTKGIALFLEPTEKFYEKIDVTDKTKFSYIFEYLRPFKWQLFFIFCTLSLGTLITLVFPFLTQNVVDKGINAKNQHVVFLLLLSQLALFFGQTIFEIIRNRIVLFVGTKININIISDFLGKLMLMPLKFFDSKRIGDLTQRIQDHKRIEIFLTSQSIVTLFSIINFSVFFAVLAYYNTQILILYLFLTFFSILWVIYFQKRRKILDYNRFELLAENQSTTYELITGMQEIKLNSFEGYKKKQWKELQQKLFKVNIKVLNLDQYQLSGYEFINNIKNIFVTYIVAQQVIKGNISLGGMLSISYIIGEMNSPISQLISFFRSLQDAKLSFSRLNEIHNYKQEQSNFSNNINPYNSPSSHTNKKNISSIASQNIILDNISFQYEGPRSPFVLKDINLIIHKGKINSIVGASGSGKTTLIKLLLKYYEPVKGKITIENNNLNEIKLEDWRKNYGVVMQDGFIFSESIERNIATEDEKINFTKLSNAIKIANIEDFISSLPLGYSTKIGSSGNGISGGQKQRILIARAVYKDPQYIFFDEATSALDAENEKKIHDNLQEFFKGKTVVIIAHRLSTVKNADNIVVLKKGEIVEQGKHLELVAKKGEYYNLVKNQLELGN